MIYNIRFKIVKRVTNDQDMNETETPRTAGRPRQFETEAVLDTALDLFWRKGYRETTTRDLEGALGMGQSSIYNTFGSKQQLLEAVLDRYEQETTEAVLEPLRHSEDGLAAIDRFFIALQEWVSSAGHRGCMLTNMMIENSTSAERTGDYRERLRGELQTALQRAADNGEVDPDIDVESRSNLLLGLVLGLNVAARSASSRDEISSIVDAIRAEVLGWRQ